MAMLARYHGIVELVEKLIGVMALTLPDHQSLPKLTQILKAKLAFN
ncbi:hypothetical protein NIES2107_74820 (plasmid) [Nostoc carneum NIES-2107]|nr:hypothetical protein NIES2107_74820 [Nostoc carneum NIES-2107]